MKERKLGRPKLVLGALFGAMILCVNSHAEEGGAFKKLDLTKQKAPQGKAQASQEAVPGVLRLGPSQIFELKLTNAADYYQAPGQKSQGTLPPGTIVKVYALNDQWLGAGMAGFAGMNFWIERANCEPLPEKTQQLLHPAVASEAEIQLALKEKIPVVGMNRQQLIKVLGNPKQKTSDENHDEVLIFEKWKTVVMESTQKYTDGTAQTSQFTQRQAAAAYRVTMRNDIVIRIEKSTPGAS